MGAAVVPTTQPFPPATTEGWVEGLHGRTWYRITGDLDVSRARGHTPLVVVHGGPGFPHDYLLRIARLATAGRAVVHYDQLGCGRSTHLPDADPGLWTVGLFVDELDALLDRLQITEDHTVLGQSWGGMLAAEHAVRRPAGLRGMVLADAPASMPLWCSGVARLRRALPRDVREVLDRHEAAGTTGAPEYAQAAQVFYDRHLLRIKPYPPEVAASFAQWEEDPTVYHTMVGPSEFNVTGTLRDWSVVDRLASVDVPVLVVRGEHDEATVECVAPFAEFITGAQLRVFPESSHMPHVEEEAAFCHAVETFLAGSGAD
ncbi:proline iminopeptidase-family hydrolase [Streptomyces sp. HUAS TT20]|uniref:proline iminopeptidase-family hydrolase n=1 Tax=Streptomyces sp. HUAS TT20 TaxID=3447509 RepID=UPI0021DA28A3|nr:proline iminopeptidase-family hydrolase [Streptomyces sp. HUAS 15-9]UXY33157.1 proline iminopeptidase-family hydrolase [Streptomyces sp. HUAS 15-9]